MNILELRTEKERTLFTISMVVSALFWAVAIIGTLGLGLIYVAAGAGAVLVAQALFLAALKSNGVKITKEQLPELYARIEKAAERLQLKQVPEAYLLNERGIFNAFATNFLGRDFVILYAELLEACDEKDGSIDFIIGHELGHIALQHLKLAPLLLPSRAVPLLGPAYSRAREYSCDRAGTVAAQDPQAAIRGLAVLAAGRRYSKRLNTLQYLEQRQASAGFWAAVVELGMSHPYLPKRMGAILADTVPEVEVPKVERNVFAYVAAPFFGAGGAGAVAMAMVMVVGVGAAIAIPSYVRATNRDSLSAMKEYEKTLDRQAEEEVKAVEEKNDAQLRAEEDMQKLAKQIEESMKAAAEAEAARAEQVQVEPAKIERVVETDVPAAGIAAAYEEPVKKKVTPRKYKTKKVTTTTSRVKAPKKTTTKSGFSTEEEIY